MIGDLFVFSQLSLKLSLYCILPYTLLTAGVRGELKIIIDYIPS